MTRHASYLQGEKKKKKKSLLPIEISFLSYVICSTVTILQHDVLFFFFFSPNGVLINLKEKKIGIMY